MVLATIDINGIETEFICTSYTTTVYEQAFRADPYERVTGDIIADVMGRMRVSGNDIIGSDEDGNLVVTIDYTRDNWQAEKRALWAMIKTATEIRRINGEKVKPTPSYPEWDRSLVAWEPDFREMSYAVCGELQRGLFRAGADASA